MFLPWLTRGKQRGEKGDLGGDTAPQKAGGREDTAPRPVQMAGASPELARARMAP